jgi:CheY-like chemotaxis protein
MEMEVWLHIKFLLGDDNQRVIRYVTEYARRRQLQLFIAESSDEVIRTASDQKPDLILIDYALEGLDGLETARIIREQAHLQSTPIIITSGQDLPAAGKRPLRPAQICIW